MIKKINFKTIKLIKFYNLINHNLIYNNKAINRYKKDNFEISEDKTKNLELFLRLQFLILLIDFFNFSKLSALSPEISKLFFLYLLIALLL